MTYCSPLHEPPRTPNLTARTPGAFRTLVLNASRASGENSMGTRPLLNWHPPVNFSHGQVVLDGHRKESRHLQQFFCWHAGNDHLHEFLHLKCTVHADSLLQLVS